MLRRFATSSCPSDLYDERCPEHLKFRTMGRITYENPPLVEVTFGIRFRPLGGFRAAHYGLFWSKLRSDFTESVDRPQVGIFSASVAAEEWFQLPRVWLLHKDSHQLIQLQPNRFYFNWRKGSVDAVYPRFGSLEPLFKKYLEKWVAFAAEASLGPFEIQGCELAYTNHIFKGEGWDTIADVGRIFPDLSWRHREGSDGRLRGLVWLGAFEFQKLKIDAEVKSARTSSGEPRELLSLELRASSTGNWDAGFSAISQWMSDANESIVSTFEDLTDKRMQTEVWKRVSS